jgi:hypothetical protein
MVMAALKGSFILWLRGGSNIANQMQGKRKTMNRLEEKDRQLELNDEYEEDHLLKINLKKLTELEAENGTINDLENTQEGVDAMTTNLNGSLPEMTDAYGNVHEMLLPSINKWEMNDNNEDGNMNEYFKLDAKERELAKERIEEKKDRLVEGEAEYDPLDKYEEIEEIPELVRKEEYELQLPKIMNDKKARVIIEVCPASGLEGNMSTTIEEEENS